MLEKLGILPKLEYNLPKRVKSKSIYEIREINKVIEEKTEEQKKFSSEKLTNMDNREFLTIPMERRLKYITNPPVLSEKISLWKIQDLKFSFTFDWTFNKELYLKTTAWQVLPREVQIVKSWWIEYERKWLKWEFFSWWNRRLIIHEDTEINIKKIRSKDDIKKIEKNNIKEIKKYIKENANSDNYQDIISESVKRWINPKIAILAFWDKIKKLPLLSIKRWILLEEMFTEYDRKKWQISTAIEYSQIGIDVLILREFWWKNWKEKAKEYWIKEEVIKKFETKEYSKWEFLKVAKENSIRIEKEYGIPWQVVLWMSLLESWNWQSKLTKLWNNVFWHKAKLWESSIEMITWEYRNWKYWKEMAKFRSFIKIEESFDAYARLLTKASRYKWAFYYKDNPEKFLFEVIQAWYATLDAKKYVRNVKSRLKTFWERLS